MTATEKGWGREENSIVAPHENLLTQRTQIGAISIRKKAYLIP